MNLKEFINMCLEDIQNSIHISKLKTILPLSSGGITLDYANDAAISLTNGKKTIYIPHTIDGYFLCEQIIQELSEFCDIENLGGIRND